MIYFFDLLPNMRATLKEQAREKMILEMLKNPPKISPAKHDNPKIITDVKVKEDGTVRTYIEGEKYPVRFYTKTEKVWVIACYKRLFSLMFGSVLGIVVLLLGRKIWSRWLQFVFEANSVLLKERYYSQPVKEIRRVLKGKLDENYVDMISMVFQTDMAYCYRMQDLLGETDKEAFNKNPIKELKRLLGLYEERELLDKNKNIIRKIKKFVWLLRIYGLKHVKEIINDLRIEEIKLSEEDIYWTNIQEGYEYRGISLKERQKLNLVEKQ